MSCPAAPVAASTPPPLSPTTAGQRLCLDVTLTHRHAHNYLLAPSRPVPAPCPAAAARGPTHTLPRATTAPPRAMGACVPPPECLGVEGLARAARTARPCRRRGVRHSPAGAGPGCGATLPRRGTVRGSSTEGMSPHRSSYRFVCVDNFFPLSKLLQNMNLNGVKEHIMKHNGYNNKKDSFFQEHTQIRNNQ